MKKTLLFYIIIYILFPHISLSAEFNNTKVLICSKIKNNIISEKCFNSTLNTNDVKKNDNYPQSYDENTHITTVSRNDWLIEKTTSKIDGSTSVAYYTDSVNDLSDFIKLFDTERLVIYYEFGELNAYIECPYSFDEYVDIIFKIDNNPPVEELWQRGADRHTLFSRKPLDFIKKISAGQKIIFRVEPRGRVPEEIEFHISGIDKISRELTMLYYKDRK